MSRLGSLAAAAAMTLLACGPAGPKTYETHGEVVSVLPAEKQVVVAHEDIPGLMPPMTMSFDVPDAALLAKLAPGQRIHFRIAHTETSYRIVAADVEGEAGASGGASKQRPTPAAALDPAPDFDLVDQHGRPLSLASLRGQTIVLDFIFTHCPGPCPILTGLQKDVRSALTPEQRTRTRFVSITLDPERDTPEVLRAYAEKRGVDDGGWSFLTGPPETVNAVVRSYGVGVIRRAGQEPEHLVATFVIDGQGRIAHRILGLDPPVAERVQRVVETLDRGGASS